ncbi:MAG: hypothetical protein AAF823_08150 [Planctomycetota bacterium]
MHSDQGARVVRTGWLALACLAFACVAGGVSAQEVPFDAVVVGETTQVRAGAGPAYYLVGSLEPGTRVTVREVYYGWNRVDAPEGVFSFISKAMVDAEGDGSRGRVNQDGSGVRAASIEGAGPSYRKQMSLNIGDVVRIVGEDGSFYKIVPPTGASVYLPPGSVRRAEQVEAMSPAEAPARDVHAEAALVAAAIESESGSAARVAVATPEASSSDEQVAIAREVPLDGGSLDLTAIDPSQMVPAGDAPGESVEADTGGFVGNGQTAEPGVVEPTPTVVVIEPDTDVVVIAPAEPEPVAEVMAADAATSMDDAEPAADAPVAQAAVETSAESAALRAVELEQLPKFDLPVEEQPLDEMIEAYLEVGPGGLSEADQDLRDFRLAVLEQNRRVAEVLRGVVSARRGLGEMPPPASGSRSATDYDAVGRLLASSVYNGASLPLMFRLVEPSSGRTVAYVKPGLIGDSRAMLGRIVGVLGPTRYDPVLKLNVVQLETIEALDPSE